MENQKIIQVEEKVPFKMLLPLSIQHMFAMFGASVLVPFVFGEQISMDLRQGRTGFAGLKRSSVYGML